MMGQQVGDALRSYGANVIGTVRNASKYKDLISKLEKRGIKVIEADVTKPETLSDVKSQEIQVAISCLQGGRHVIVEGQKNLVQALASTGKLEKFIPTDFAIDLFKIPRNEHPFLGIRREFDEDILWPLAEKYEFKTCHVLNGCFLSKDFFWDDVFAILDKKKKSLRYYGSPDVKYDLTTTDDTAKFIAKAALDEDAPRMVKVRGDSISVSGIKKVVKEVRGVDLELECLGSEEDLRKKMEDGMKNEPDNLYNWVAYCYKLPMVNESAKFADEDVVNGKYPDVKAMDVREYVKQNDIMT